MAPRSATSPDDSTTPTPTTARGPDAGSESHEPHANALQVLAAEIDGAGGHVAVARTADVSVLSEVGALADDVQAVTASVDAVLNVAGIDTTSPQFRKVKGRFERRAVSPDRAAQKIIAGMLARRPPVYSSRDIQGLHLVQPVAPSLYGRSCTVRNIAAARAARNFPTLDAAR